MLFRSIVGARDIRVTDQKRLPGEGSEVITGTFLVSTTKATDLGRYDLVATGRLNVGGREERIVSRAIPFEVTAGSIANDLAASTR